MDFAADISTYPANRPYGDAIGAYVDPAEMETLSARHGAMVARQMVRRNAARRIIERKALEPTADRELLAVLLYLVDR